MENEVTYEILKHLCVLKTSPAGYTKEVNIIKWNDGNPKIDIREWTPDHSRCMKGLTFSYEEGEMLVDALSGFVK